MLVFLLIFIICFALDVVTKVLATNMNGVITIIPNFFEFHYVLNEGAAWSIGEGYLWVFTLLGILVAIGIIIFSVYSWKKKDKFMTYLMAFVLAGVLGNCLERLFFGHVTDFISFIFGDYYFPIFNVADILICCGMVVFIVCFNLDGKEKKEK